MTPYCEFNYDRYIRLLYESCLSQTEVAKRSGISLPTVSTITTKKHTKPSPLTIAKLAKGFGVDYTELLLQKKGEFV